MKYKVRDWVVQIELSKDKLSGVYYKKEDDIKQGTLDLRKISDLFKGYYIDPNGNQGSMHIRMTDEGFWGRWSSNLDSDKPKGNWDGIRIDNNTDSQEHFSKNSIYTDQLAQKVWLNDGAEDVGVYFSKTEYFTPVENYKKLAEFFNYVYKKDDYAEEEDLVIIESKNNGKEIQITTSTHTICINEDIGHEYVDYEELNSFFLTKGFPEYLIPILTEIIYNGGAPTEELIKLFIKPGQKVKVEVTDQEYGNDEYTIEV